MSVRQDLSSGEWQLVIQDIRYSDAGQYECQINTSPVLSHTLTLDVVGMSPNIVTCSLALNTIISSFLRAIVISAEK